MNTHELGAKRPKKEACPRVRMRVTALFAYLMRMRRALTSPIATATRANRTIHQPKRSNSSGATMYMTPRTSRMLVPTSHSSAAATSCTRMPAWGTSLRRPGRPESGPVMYRG